MLCNKQPNRTQTERRAETERRLLDAAMDLVAEGGVGAVTVAATGARAGYSRGIVNHHFGSRRALLDALAREVQGRFAPPTAEAARASRACSPSRTPISSTLGERARDSQVFLVLWTEAIATDADLRPIFAERDEAFRRGMAAAVAAGVADGSIRADADPPAAAVTLVGLLRGVGLQRLLAAGRVDLARCARSRRAPVRNGLRPGSRG